jgi:hypothetical protein
MTAKWRKQLSKIADVMVTIKASSPLWPTEMLEPVTLCLISPILSASPWIMRRTQWLTEQEDSMQEVLRSVSKAGRSCLRKFWYESWSRS